MDPQTPASTPSLQDNSSPSPAGPVMGDLTPGESSAVMPDDAASNDEALMQQIAEQLQAAKNVLVTVRADPTVDELSAMLGLTLLLDKMGKHATALYGGKTPPAINFLKPEETLENTVNSLRDFIVALSTEKADKIRTKVEGDVVKIYITPYKSVITEKDFNFTQGDFNVDVVVALGVEDRQSFDKAILTHGRILHDATVITVNTGTKGSTLGTIDWLDPEASSVAEMASRMCDALDSQLLDEQISTALLTGIVAETNRFSNEKTTPKVMNIAAQLMATGANQQLVATNLRHEGEIAAKDQDESETVDAQSDSSEGELALNHGTKNSQKSSKKLKKQPEKSPVSSKNQTPPLPIPATQPEQQNIAALQEALEEATVAEPPQSEDSSEDTSRDAPESTSESDKTSQDTEPEASPGTQTPQMQASKEPENGTDQEPAELTSREQVPESTDRHEHKRIEPLHDEAEILEQRAGITREKSTNEPQPLQPAIQMTPNREEMRGKPTFGGTFNATASDVEESRQQQTERESQQNHVALSHDEAPSTPAEPQADALEEARKLVEDAADAEAFNPAHKPEESVNAVEMVPTIHHHEQTPDSSAQAQQADQSALKSSAEATGSISEKTPDPMQSFMQPHTEPEQAAAAPPPPIPAPSDLPPLPPMPGGMMPASGGDLPPLPPMPVIPGQSPLPSGSDTMAPITAPAFMQSVSSSQNAWSQAGDDLAKVQADKDAARQQKMDQRAQQYEEAVNKNLELQGKPPLSDQSVFPLPPPPIH